MSDGKEPNLEDGPQADFFADSDAPGKKDEIIASLEKALENSQDQRGEERFLWILVTLILGDALIFIAIENWAAAIIIGILQLILVWIVADKCGVDSVAPLIDKLTGMFAKNGKE